MTEPSSDNQVNESQAHGRPGSSQNRTPHDRVPQDKASHEQEPEDYVSHNFEAMNRAIDTEVDKRVELNSLYQHQQTSRKTLMILHLTLSFCVICITATVIWWLLNPNQKGLEQVTLTPNNSAAFDRSTHDALNIISKQEEQKEAERSFINTSFTVFHRTLIPTGEYVVTGKTYLPQELSYPDEQYCYLEQSESSSGLSGEPLAAINEGHLVLETDDKALIAFAKKYCQFSQH